MNIFELDPKDQDLLINEFSKHVTESRLGLIHKVIKNRTRYLTLVLEDIYQSHNAAAVVRSCDALGIQDIHVIENRNKLVLDKTTVSKGADKWITFSHYNLPHINNTEACIHSLKKKGYKIAATTLGKESISINQLPIDQPIAIMIGTEKDGLSETACKLADYSIEIPMYGFTQSYNLSVCAALTLYTLTNRLRDSNIQWQLSDHDKRQILLTWFQRCIVHWDSITQSVLKSK